LRHVSEGRKEHHVVAAAASYGHKGPSTRVRIRLRKALRFHTRFAAKELQFLSLYVHFIKPFVNTFQKKLIPNSIAIYIWHQIVHRIVRRFVHKFVRVDGP
jgi:hypothetical protein